jgi:hypothetical protein
MSYTSERQEPQNNRQEFIAATLGNNAIHLRTNRPGTKLYKRRILESNERTVTVK